MRNALQGARPPFRGWRCPRAFGASSRGPNSACGDGCHPAAALCAALGGGVAGRDDSRRSPLIARAAAAPQRLLILQGRAAHIVVVRGLRAVITACVPSSQAGVAVVSTEQYNQVRHCRVCSTHAQAMPNSTGCIVCRCATGSQAKADKL